MRIEDIKAGDFVTFHRKRDGAELPGLVRLVAKNRVVIRVV